MTNQKYNKLSNTFETGLPDHQKPILTVAKSGSFEERPREKIHRSYTSFKIERHNNNLFMTTELRKAMMKRSHLKNRYDKNRNYENWYLNEKQRDFCVSFLRKKKNYLENVKIQDITDNKKFWKTIRSYFSGKGYKQTRITIVKKDSIITDEKNATLMNNYFINIKKNVDLKPLTVSNAYDIDEITQHLEDHISICNIKEAYSEI